MVLLRSTFNDPEKTMKDVQVVFYNAVVEQFGRYIDHNTSTFWVWNIYCCHGYTETKEDLFAELSVAVEKDMRAMITKETDNLRACSKLVKEKATLASVLPNENAAMLSAIEGMLETPKNPIKPLCDDARTLADHLRELDRAGFALTDAEKALMEFSTTKRARKA
jgi:hypothetical protein